MADDVGDLPRRRRGQRALAEPPARLIERGLRLFDPALGGGDFIVARRQLGDREVGGQLFDPRRSDVVGGLRAIEIGLRRKAAPAEVARAIERALVVFALQLGGVERRLDRGDLLRPPAVEDVGELSLGLRERAFGVAHRDDGVGRLDRTDRLAGLDQIAAAHVERDDARDLDRRDLHVLAFDIADDGGDGRLAGGEPAGDQADRAQGFEDHARPPLAAASAVWRCAVSIERMASPSRGPMPLQPSRRSATRRATRK